jgi:hypothetical protein
MQNARFGKNYWKGLCLGTVNGSVTVRRQIRTFDILGCNNQKIAVDEIEQPTNNSSG